MSWDLGEPSQKSIRIKICKKILTQFGPNPWRTELARGFQPILTAIFTCNMRLCREVYRNKENSLVLSCNV